MWYHYPTTTVFYIVGQVGSYEGFLAVWESVLRAEPGVVPPRTRKAIESLRVLVDRFPHTHQAAAETDFLDLVEKTRAKYRQVCSGVPGDTPTVSRGHLFLMHQSKPPPNVTTRVLAQLAPASGGGPEGLIF